jgi:NADH:ubiquinone oxidoreductase subunit H
LESKALSAGVFILVSVIKSVIVLVVLLTAVAYTVWLERKVVGHMQNRWGPTRVGPFGLLQPAADGLKFLFKEDLTPPHVYKPLFLAAPMMALIFALTSISVIPFGNSITLWGTSIPLEITDLNIGLLLILGVTSLGVYGVALAGWSSNNKYSLLGGLRASAQMVSYEIALGLSLVGVLIQSGSFSLRAIVDAQGGRFLGFIPRWNIFHGQFIGFFIYLMAAYAESDHDRRSPRRVRSSPSDLRAELSQIPGRLHPAVPDDRRDASTQRTGRHPVAHSSNAEHRNRLVRPCHRSPPLPADCEVTGPTSIAPAGPHAYPHEQPPSVPWPFDTIVARGPASVLFTLLRSRQCAAGARSQTAPARRALISAACNLERASRYHHER